jgi:hypothetical protein
MKKFNAPVIDIEKFEMMDVISTSTGTGCENELVDDRDE